MTPTYGVVLFEYTYDAIRAEQILKLELPITVMPAPRRFSASCGIALRFPTDVMARVKEVLKKNHIPGRVELLDEE